MAIGTFHNIRKYVEINYDNLNSIITSENIKTVNIRKNNKSNKISDSAISVYVSKPSGEKSNRSISNTFPDLRYSSRTI